MAHKMFHIVGRYMSGKIKCAEFAITNTCITQCTFCNIWKQKPKVFVDKEKALQAIDHMSELGVSHLTLTGGEPLLHPNIIDFVQRAYQRKMHNSVLDAAPQLLLRGDLLKQLEAAGTDMISISFDSGDPAVMAESRKMDGIMSHMENAMKAVVKTKLKSMASVLIWNDNYNHLEDVCEKALQMGFDYISFNYPTFSESDVYELGGCGISLSRDKIIYGLESAIQIKKTGKYPILNSVTSMENIINYIKDPSTVTFHCLGGSRVLFVDWFLRVHPCMQLSDDMGSILEIGEKDLNRPACNNCNMSWYRDFSTIFSGTRSIPVLVEMLRDSGGIL